VSGARQLWARVRDLLPRRAEAAELSRDPLRNVIAGVTTGVVALPLALAFGVAAGLGARAGLVTAVVAGALAAVFGGSRVQVSGPTGAMAVVLAPLVAAHGPGGVALAGILAGLLLCAAAVGGLGRYVRFLPVPVVEGFTAGIAVVIAAGQLPAALGVAAHSGGTLSVTAAAVVDAMRHPHPMAVAVTVGTAAVMVAGARLAHAFPASLVAVAAATVVAQLTGAPLARIGAVPSGLPHLQLGALPWSSAGTLLPSAMAIAALAGIESLLAATVADSLAGGPRHHADRELFGQGIANVVAPALGGIPATGAVARTAVNIRAGATSRLAALVHAVLLAGVVLVAAPVVARVPVAALAGVLMVTAARMADVRGVLTLLRSGGTTALVTVVTLATTVVFNLVTAVEVGVAAAAVAALRAVAAHARVETLPPRGAEAAAGEAQSLLDEHVAVFRIDGALFFATAHRLLGELFDVADVRVVVLRMSGLATVDLTGARLLADAVAGLQAHGATVLLSAVRAEHRATLQAGGVLTAANGEYPDIDAALAAATQRVRETAAV